MSSLCFTKPILVDGLSEEAAAEFVGLQVGLALEFPGSVGLLQEASVRRWDEEKKIYRCDEPAPPINPCALGEELSKKYFWVSRHALTLACKNQKPNRMKLLIWLKSEQGSDFEYFAVDKDVAEYLP